MYGFEYLFLTLVSRNPFRNLTVNAEDRKRQFGHHPPPDRTYCIMLTPRSGSSRLADILTRTEALGVPREYFNPGTIPGAAQSMNADNLTDYVTMLRRMRCRGGVFGLRITYRQMREAFRHERRFHAAFCDATWFWLIREDIVEQAISSSRMVQTDLRHLEKPAPDQPRHADARFHYRPRDFKHRIRRLRWMEQRSEHFFRRFAIQPVRLSHERLLEMSPRQTADLFAQGLGMALSESTDPATEHARVSTEKSTEFARRFRAENTAWMTRIDAARAAMLAALDAPASTAESTLIQPETPSKTPENTR